MNKTTEKKIVLYCMNNILKKPDLCKLEYLYGWFEDFARPLFGIDIEAIWQGRRGNYDSKKQPRHYNTIRKLLKGKTGELILDKTVTAIIEAFRISPKYHDVLALRIYSESIHSVGRLLGSQPDEYVRHIAASMVGLSRYARHLAARLKMKVLHKRASDLLSTYVGETEYNIAEAFDEAKRKNLMLVIDEADTFLRDRREAQRSWEVSQVNEMLTQMESHPLPFVCTTNLMGDLDRASLRRFTFKVKYDYLSRKQVDAAFRHFFGTAPSVSLSGLTCLSPGDFSVVAKKARICGIDDHRELVELLRQEEELKDEKENSIGFVTNG